MAQYLDPECVDEVMECPLCMDPLDLTEKCFKPCPCGYQMCSFCFHRIVDSEGNKCPACRRSYNPDNYTHLQVRAQEFRGQSAKGKPKGRGTGKEEPENRTSLANIRVVQRNLVYVTNLSLDVAKEEILRKNEFFSQYGKIAKMVVNRSNVYQGSSVSCYITYSKPDEAYRCIEAVDGCILNDRTLRASFGTTKYCSYFLRNRHCTNPDCMYLHEYGDEKDSFTKEDMQAGKHLARVPPPQAHHVSTRSYGLPPPRNSLRSSMTPVTKPVPSNSAAPSSSSITAPPSATNTVAAPSAPSAAAALAAAANNASLAWKTQSVGPSMAQMQQRRNDMGDATIAQKIAQNTATLMQQYEDESEDDEEFYDDESDEDAALQPHNFSFADETAFPSLGKAPSPSPVATAPTTTSSAAPSTTTTSNTTNNASSTATAPNVTKETTLKTQETKKTAPAPSAPAAAAPAPTPVTTTPAATQTSTSPAASSPTNAATTTNSNSKSGASQQEPPAPSRANNHSKSHWHAKEKPVWQPKAVQKVEQPASGTSASTSTPASSNASSTSPSTESESNDSGDGNSLKSSKSPWKATPTPVPVSISVEIHKSEEAKATQTKLAAQQQQQTQQQSAALAAAKGSSLPASVSWASPTGKVVSPRSSSNNVEPEMIAELNLTAEKSEKKESAPVAPVMPAATQTQPAQANTSQHTHQKSHGKHGKGKAAFAKAAPLAPPKEPVFDAPAPAAPSTVVESVKAEEKPQEDEQRPEINTVMSSTSSASTDDELPPISFVPESSNESPEETEEGIEGEREFPNYLSSAFSAFGVPQAASIDASPIVTPSIGRAEPGQADLSSINDRYSLYGGGPTVVGQSSLGGVSGASTGVAPIGRPTAAMRSDSPVTETSSLSQSSAPLSFSLLAATDMWGSFNAPSQGNNPSSTGNAFMQPYSSTGTQQQPSWSSFGTNNLFSPYSSPSAGSAAPTSQLWGETLSSDSSASRSRFSFASAADPPVSSTNSQSSQSRNSAPHPNMGMMGQPHMPNSAIGALPSSGGPPSGTPGMRMQGSSGSGGDMPPGLFTGNPNPPMSAQHAPMAAPMASMGSSPAGVPNQSAATHQQQQQQMQMNFLFQQQNMKMHAMHHPHHPAHAHHHSAPHNQPQAPYGAGPGWSWFQPQQAQDWSGAGAPSPNPSTPGHAGGQSILSVLSAGMNASSTNSGVSAQSPTQVQSAPQQPQQHQQHPQHPQQNQQQRYAPPQWGMPMPHGQFMGFGEYPGFHPGSTPHSQQPPSHMDHQQ